jgi:hypothetical protein
MRRAAPDRVVTFAEKYRFPEPGELLSGTDDPRFGEAWKMARADSFAVLGARAERAVPVAAE